MMSELEQQNENDRFESKFEPQDVDLKVREEKLDLQQLLQLKPEPKEIKEDFTEVDRKCACAIKAEEEEPNPLYQQMPFAKDETQKIMYELKEQDGNVTFESKFPSQDLGLIEAEQKCSQPFTDVKSEPEVLDGIIKNKNSSNDYDNIKSEEDHKFINKIYDSTLSIHGNDVNEKSGRNSDVLVTNYRASCNTPIHTDTRTFSCEVCGKSFNKKSTLNTHLLIHIGDRPFCCDVCGKSFKTKTHLKGHLLIHTDDRPFSCKVCGKSFKDSSALRRHLIIHTGDRPYSCEMCGKSYNDRRNLKTHLLIHTGDRPFSCEVCGKSFILRSTLKTHLLFHTGGRPISCEVCGKCFILRSTLKTHLLIHTGDRPFSCEVCGKSFNQKSRLKSHLLIHTGDHKYSCEECGKCFNRRQTLKTHLHIH